MSFLLKVVAALLLTVLYSASAFSQCAYCATRAYCAAAPTGFQGCTFQDGACYNYGSRCGSGGSSYWYWDEISFQFWVWPDDSDYDFSEKLSAPGAAASVEQARAFDRPRFRLRASVADLQAMAGASPRLAQVFHTLLSRSNSKRVTSGEYVTSRSWQGLSSLRTAMQSGVALPALDDDVDDMRFAVSLRKLPNATVVTIFEVPNAATTDTEVLTVEFSHSSSEFTLNGGMLPVLELGTWRLATVQMYRQESPSAEPKNCPVQR